MTRKAKPKSNPTFEASLWLWGRMRDFERDGYDRKDVLELMRWMTPTMRADLIRIAPLMAQFFQNLEAMPR